MAGTKISEATLRETLKGTENIPITDTDLPKGRTTVEKLKEYVQPDLGGYAEKTGAEFTGTIAAPIVAFMRESKGMMAAIQADSNNILFRTYNAGVDSITFQVQNSVPLKLTEAGIWENNQLLENKYAQLTDLDNLATKTELGAKQDALVSGTNIKTINSQSLLGEGNIEITVEGGGISDAPSDGKLYGRKDSQWTEVVIPDTSNLATKDDLSAKLDTATYNEGKATFALKTEIPDTSNLATKSELSDYLPVSYAQSTYATKSELGQKLDVETYNSDKATFALKSEIPDTSDFATKSELSDGLAGKANTAHTHTVSQITDLSTTLSGYATTTALTEGLAGKANTSHTHAISDVTNLQYTLDSKAAAIHTHTVSQITDLNLGNYATTSSVAAAIAEAEFNTGHNTSSNIGSIPVTKRLVIATISGGGSFALASTPADGREIQVIVRSTGGGEISLPNSGNYTSMSGDSITLAAGAYADINVVSDGTHMYIRAL